MRLISRNDGSLAVALIAAAVILFQQPLRYLFDLAQDIETRYHVDLLPALVLLIVVFVFHEYQKRASAKADARAAAAEAAQARTRFQELEQLMAFGQALANALDRASLQQALFRYLPTFAHQREFWVLVRNHDRWESLLDDGATSRPVELLAEYASRALSVGGAVEDAGRPSESDDCFPLLAAGSPIGVVGVRGTPPLTVGERNALGAAAALIAISVRNVQLFLETRELSLRDGLTGCFNRAHALETLDAELRRARRNGRPLSILMLDVDHFKTINDGMGHLRGDELLRRIGIELTKVLRSTDVRCRYGGDEFLIILPETPGLGAEHVAESLRLELAKLTISAAGQSMSITVSIGVAVTIPSDRTPDQFIQRADEALYRAKRSGRNQFSVAAPAPTLALLRCAAAEA